MVSRTGGTALANILKGTVNPSGKLPMSIEKKWEDNPVHDNFFSKNGEKEITYQEGLFYGYRGYDAQDKRPLFPFGFGLSYTTFSYSDIKAQPLGKNRLRVTFKVTNTGKRAGAEVAELYVCPLKSKVVRPVKELKGYEKVYLEIFRLKSGMTHGSIGKESIFKLGLIFQEQKT